MHDSFAVPSFPFLKLPRELRDEVYHDALQPHVDFTTKQPYQPDVNDTTILHHEIDDEYYLTTVSYKLMVHPSLFLVSKEVSAEAREVVSHLTSSLRKLLSAVSVRRRFTELLSTAFLSVCQCSRFMLRGEPSSTLSFLALLTPRIRQNIRSLVITRPTLSAVGYENYAWSRRSADGRLQKFTRFTTFLQSRMPQLQEVALFVPSTDNEDDYYCSYAPQEMCQLLQDGILKVVRFLFTKKFPPSYNMMDLLHVETVIRPNVEWSLGMDEERYTERLLASQQQPDKFVLTREDDVWPSTLPHYRTVVALRKPHCVP